MADKRFPSLLDAGCARNRHVDPRGSDAAGGESVRIQDQLRWVGVGQLDGWRDRRGFAGAYPPVQAGERGLQDIVVLRREIDGMR